MTVLIMHLLEWVDTLWYRLADIRRAVFKRAGPAGAAAAGAGVQSPEAVSLLEIEQADWPDFPTLAHSFWRAQELTLFRRHRDLFSVPALDLGCGDRIFGQLAGFPGEGLGADLDRASLKAAKRGPSSLPLVLADVARLPVGDRRFAVCLSNSVLEHLPSLDACFLEVARTLKPGGLFIFSITLRAFTAQLRQLTGTRDANRWVKIFGHHQEPTEEELVEKLERHGFAVETQRSYQPICITAIYRMLVSPVVQFVERKTGKWMARRARNWLARQVVRSITDTPGGSGACCFVVAKKMESA